MLDDDVHVIPLHVHKQHAVVVYLFRIETYHDTETGYWYATHPLLTDENEQVHATSRYEAICSAQVYLRHKIKDDPAALERHGYKTRVIATDKPEAVVLGTPLNHVDGAYAPYDREDHERFLNDICTQYAGYASAADEHTQKLTAVLRAVQDVFYCTSSPPAVTLTRVHEGLIKELTDYVLRQCEGYPIPSRDDFLDRVLASFMCTVATAVADHVYVTDAKGTTKIGGFIVPAWFVSYVNREWKRNARFRQEAFAYHFDAYGQRDEKTA